MRPPCSKLDPRLAHEPSEKIIRKKYASCFKGTNFHEMLAGLRVDTLIVTGVSTSHCVYATCRDAADSYHVIVPRQAVGERCELMHEVNLLDIDMELGDVMPCDQVVQFLEHMRLSGVRTQPDRAQGIERTAQDARTLRARTPVD